jgi:hypothetical protein
MNRALLLATLCLAAPSCGGGDGGDPASPPDDRDPDPYPYPSGKVFFQSPPVELDRIIIYESLGLLAPDPETHGGFHHQDIGAAEPTIAVLAPADGQILGIGNRPFRGRDDYWLVLKMSTTISVKYGHIGRIADPVLTESGPIGAETQVRVPVTAGQVIGFVSPLSALDLAISDTDLRLSWYYPEDIGIDDRWAADIFDHYRDPVRQEILDLTIRQFPPRGGKVDYDVRETLSGAWYLQGTNRDELRNGFSFAYDHIHGERMKIFDGLAWIDQHIGPGSQSLWTFWVKGNGPKPETVNVGSGRLTYEAFPAFPPWRTITPTEWVLWDTTGVESTPVTTTYLVEMLAPETVRLEKFDGRTADEVTDFTSNARVYVRKP